MAREFEELSSQCKAKAKNIAACLRASRQCHGPDLTGRRGSFTRSSLLRLLGQILRHKATPQLGLLIAERPYAAQCTLVSTPFDLLRDVSPLLGKLDPS